MGATLAVMIGGAIGALLRLCVSQAFAPSPWTTLGINWLGCLILGFFLTYAGSTKRIPDWVRVGFSVGVLGGFTTFSTFSVDVWQLFQASQPTTALGYGLGSLLGGVLLSWLGMRTAQRVVAAR